MLNIKGIMLIIINDKGKYIIKTTDEIKNTEDTLKILSYILWDHNNGLKALMRDETNYKEMEYKEYLNTPHWKFTRDCAIEYYGDNCCLCGSAAEINVHHRNYDNKGNEKMQDLIVLCNDCHSKFHGIEKTL